MKRILLSIAFISLFCSASRLDAAQAQDSLAVRSYDASDYSLMKRWRPQDAVPFGTKAADNLFFGVSGSGYRTMYRGYSVGPHLSFHIGKWFNPYSALRIAPGVGYYFDNGTKARIKQVDIKASYMFNFMTYFGGYRPSRFVEIMTVTGLGYTYGWSSYPSHAVTAHLGLNFTAHIMQNVRMFFEPLVELSVDGLGRPANAVKYRIMPYLIGTVGLSVRLGEDSWDNVPSGKWYLQLMGGTQMQISDVARNELSMSDAFGMHFSFGVGRNYWHWAGLRLSFAYSKNNWEKTLGRKLLASQYAAGRIEATVDLVSLIMGRESSRFCLSVMAGPEAGIFVKDRIGRRYTPYVGITGAVQAKTRLSDKFAIFVEPRATMIPYPGLSSANASSYTNYYDGIFNCSLGVEYRL